jgi:uncharacterized protein
MHTESTINWPVLWDAVQKQYQGNFYSIHGVDHWKRVERNGLHLANAACLAENEIVVVRLFAVFHDSQRRGDGWEPEHGPLAAAYARSMRGTLFDLDDALMKKLAKACEDHDRGFVTPDPIVGCCWDADRLDLVRIGARLNPDLMSTSEGKRLARPV